MIKRIYVIDNEFLKKAWNTIKDDLLEVFHKYFLNGIVNQYTNETYVYLIPKRKCATKAKDFRPISLVTSLYNVISKVLVERLKEILPPMIDKSQMAFVRGRQIMDVILIVAEVTGDYLSKKKKDFIIKVDFEKAHNMVDWDYLDYMMQLKGFGDKWMMKWIKGCCISSNFSIMINGKLRGKIKVLGELGRGILFPLSFSL